MSDPTDTLEPAALPVVPAWAVGADAEHTGPSGMGPGTDRPGFGEADPTDLKDTTKDRLKPEEQ